MFLNSVVKSSQEDAPNALGQTLHAAPAGTHRVSGRGSPIKGRGAVKYGAVSQELGEMINDEKAGVKHQRRPSREAGRRPSRSGEDSGDEEDNGGAQSNAGDRRRVGDAVGDRAARTGREERAHSKESIGGQSAAHSKKSIGGQRSAHSPSESIGEKRGKIGKKKRGRVSEDNNAQAQLLVNIAEFAKSENMTEEEAWELYNATSNPPLVEQSSPLTLTGAGPVPPPAPHQLILQAQDGTRLGPFRVTTPVESVQHAVRLGEQEVVPSARVPTVLGEKTSGNKRRRDVEDSSKPKPPTRNLQHLSPNSRLKANWNPKWDDRTPRSQARWEQAQQ